jgi:hypothetical protein
MSNELRFPDQSPDREVVDALQPLLTPPTDNAAYWDGLQHRIMARIASVGTPASWWSISPTMAKAGLIAAGLAVLILGALVQQTREIEARMAVQSVTETEMEVARILPGVDEPSVHAAPRAPAPSRSR